MPEPPLERKPRPIPASAEIQSIIGTTDTIFLIAVVTASFSLAVACYLSVMVAPLRRRARA